MKKNFKYDPEDIESLMLAKPFEALLPEERTFVLKHLSSEQEYESMRQLLLESMQVLQTNQPEPPGKLKEKMLAEYRSHHETRGFGKIWLNFMVPVWKGLWDRPYLSLAMASVVLFLGVFFWLDTGEPAEMAVQTEKSPTKRPVKEQIQQPAPTEQAQQGATTDAPIPEKDIVLRESKPEQDAAADINEQARALDREESETSPVSALADEAEAEKIEAKDQRTTHDAGESLGQAEFAANSNAPTPAAARSFDAVSSMNAPVSDLPKTGVINDELFALLYTAR